MTQGIQEQGRGLPAIETESHFVQIGCEMLCRDAMPCANDPAFQERECRFYGVCVDISVNIDLRLMLDRLVLRSKSGVPERRGIGVEFVCNDYLNVFTHVFADVLRQGSCLHVLGMKESEIAATLPDANHDLLIGISVSCFAVRVLFAAEVSFIHFDSAVHHGPFNFLHGCPDAMAEIPCGLVRAFVISPDRALELKGAHPFFSLAEQQRRKKPLLQGQMGIVEDRASGDSELIITALAVEQLLDCFQFHNRAFAAHAFNAVRPAQTNQQFAAFVVGVEQVYNVN